MKKDNRVWGPPVEGCRLSISVPRPRIFAGRPVALTVVLRNDGPGSIRVPRVSMWFDFQYAISLDGKPIPLSASGEQMKKAHEAGGGGALPEIAPGHELSSTVEISKLYDFHLPGKYQVVASRTLPGRTGEGVFRILSNKLAIEIVPE